MLAWRTLTFRNRERTRAQKVCPLPGRLCLASSMLGVLHTLGRFALTALPIAVMLAAAFFLSRGVHCVTAGRTSSPRETETVVAVRLAGRTDAEGFPSDAAWQNASPIKFDHDWQGRNADPQRETEVRLLWAQD